jgi:hypothetical protein
MEIIITEEQLSGILNEVRAKESDRDKIYQDENIVVVAPLTHKASCKYGAHTKWCTATPSNSENFKEYMEYGVLIYFIIRSPYKNAKKPEYKFAYFHSYNPNEIPSGWYDMSDYNWNSDEDSVDMNLIKFLIPDDIFKLVEDYIANQKPVWEEREKQKKVMHVNYIMNDPASKVIVDNNDWYICYRTSEIDFDVIPRYVYFSYHSMLVIYIDKKTYDIFYQTIDYYKDLRNGEITPIQNLYTGDEYTKMRSIFKKYYKQILKGYFTARRDMWKPDNNTSLFLPLEYVNIGDTLGGYGRDTFKVHKIYKDPRTGRDVVDSIDSKGNIRKNTYYNDTVGLGVKYDKVKHNPI